jgi:putative transposase
LVCVTKYRRKVFDSKALEYLESHAVQAFAKMDCRLLACDGEADHVHLLVEYPPKLSVSAMVNMFKGTSSRMLRQARPDIAQRYWRKGVLWSPSYFAASTGGATLEMVKRYVEQQRASSSP